MTVVILLVGLVLVGLMLFGLFGFYVLGGVDRKQRKAESNADAILDEAFDGRQNVTMKVNMTTLKYETVITGAKQRGYRLEHQAENKYGPHTLMFERVVA